MDRKKSAQLLRSVGYDERNAPSKSNSAMAESTSMSVSPPKSTPAYERAVDRQLLSRQPGRVVYREADQG